MFGLVDLALAESQGTEQPPAEPFASKVALRLDVLVRSGGNDYYGHTGGNDGQTDVLEALKNDFGDEKAKMAAIVDATVHWEIRTKTLTLPGYQLMEMLPNLFQSRRRNFEADSWRGKAHENADAFVYSVNIRGSSEDYLSQRGYFRAGWEQDRFEISQLLRTPAVIEKPKKPLLLLVRIANKEVDGFDTERFVNLLGLGGTYLRRPFRAILYSSDSSSDHGVLKESLEWLAKTARAKDDESTAMMTGSDTEESSVGTSSTTGSAVPTAPQADHYVLDYEPTIMGGNPTLQLFEPIKKGTHCPFARGAKLWGGKMPNEHVPTLQNRNDPIEEVATLNAGPLAVFVARSNNGEALDGFCVEIPGANGMKVEYLGDCVRKLLTKLADLDPSPGENAMKMGPIDNPHWRFRFAGEDFFLTSFSSVYKKDSSRYAFGANRAFLLFQPTTSFGRHNLTEDTPASATNWDNPTSMRDRARVAFKKNGCPYHIPEELPYPVANHVVTPKKDDGTSVVRWWVPRETAK